MNPVLQDLLATYHTTTPNGDLVPIGGQSIDPVEADFLKQLVAEIKPMTTLEVGFAFGLSALVICDALPINHTGRHIVIDPFQNQPPWNGIGIHNVRKARFDQMIEFHESYSYVALPELQARGAMIDFAFVDGAHTFDFVFTDFFYIDKLLNQGGVVAFDDADWPSIRRVIRFVLANLPYRVYKTLPSHLVRHTFKRRMYESGIALGSFIFNGLCKIPGFQRPITSAFGAELLGIDKKYGLKGSIIALQKTGKDRRRYDHYVEF
jgi:predicted O-methyltransferase YrrM